jgi:hypothetical protein
MQDGENTAGPSQLNRNTIPLNTLVTLLPTPTAQAAKHGATPDLAANSFGCNLWDLPHLLPTPTVMDMGANYTPEEWEAWKAQQRAAHRNGNGHGASLTQEAISLLGTPRSQMGSMTAKPNGRLETDIGQLIQEPISLLPTPTATDVDKHAGQPRHKREGHQPRIADVIEYLDQWTGESTAPPSPDGSRSPDQRQHLLFTEGSGQDSAQALWNG